VLILGQPYREVDCPLLQIDMRDFVANYYGVELERLNVGNMLGDFVTILTQHGIRCPGSLTLLIRALVTLEGIGRRLDPEFNLAGHLQPFVEKLVHDRYQPGRMADRFIDRSKAVWHALEVMPGHVSRTLEKLSKDELKMQFELRGLDHFTLEIERSSNRLAVGLVMSALIVASALMLRQGSQSVWLTLPLFLVSSLLGIWLIYGIFRSGRL